MPCAAWSRRYARTHGPFHRRAAAPPRFGVPLQRVLDELRVLERRRHRRARRMRPGGRGVVRRRRAAAHPACLAGPACGPRSRPCRARRWPASCRAGSASTTAAAAAPSACATCIAQLQGAAAAGRDPGARSAGRAASRATARSCSTALCAAGEVVWWGAGDGRVALAFRGDAPLLGPPRQRADAPRGELADALRERLAAGAALLRRPRAAAGAAPPTCSRRCGTLVWAGEVDERRVRAAARAARACPAVRQVRRDGDGA